MPDSRDAAQSFWPHQAGPTASLSALQDEDAKASYLRRKKLQGKAQFEFPDDKKS